MKKIKCIVKNVNITDGDRIKNIKMGTVVEVSDGEADALASRGLAEIIGGKPRVATKKSK
jgi:hypothetical protein